MTLVSHPERVRFGPFEADLETHELWKNGMKLKLGGQPFEILAILLRRNGQMVSREELQKELWAADTFVDFNHGLNAAVNKLRETLSDSADDPQYIETLPRRGYRFIGKVETVGAPEAEAPRASAEVSSVAPPAPRGPEPDRDDRARARSRRKLVATLAVAAAALGLLLWTLFRGLENREERERATRAGQPSRVLTLVPDPASDPAISPDGKAVAFRRNIYAPGGAGIFVTSSEGQTLAQLSAHPGDCCPAWSPDGKRIAFSRIAADEYGIYVVEAAGGTPRKLSHEDPRKKRGELAWTADGKFIAFSGDSPGGGAQIFLLSIEDSSVRPLSEPQGQDRDWGPAVSPDGRQLAFVRSNGAGFPEEIFLMPLSGGPARQLTYERAAIMGPPAWSAAGDNIVFSSTKEGEPSLWRVSVAGGTAVRIDGAGTATWHPSVSRKDEIAAQKILRSSGIYRLSSEDGSPKRVQSIVTSTSGRNEGPRFSPDGRRMVSMSDRSGSLEIWVSNRDGSSPVQLTNLRGCGTPRWSPDGLWVAFDAAASGRPSVWVVSALGSTARPLVEDRFSNSVPSWSHDGKWVYFGSDRSGSDQIWKVPVEGGQPVEVTVHGGFAAMESPDGATLYYAKTRYENPQLWQMPAAGGLEMRFPGIANVKSWAAWSPTRRGIYFSPPEDHNRSASIDFYDFETRLTRQEILLDRSAFWLAATPDGKEILYDQAEQDETTVVLVDTRP
jgi:Tol biopolymer transport system component/DNA-binding winged helix-turn-helix (wHTH) protein